MPHRGAGGTIPELPEVEHARRRLAHHTAGRRVVGIELADPAVVRSRLSTTPRDAHPDAARILAAAVGGVVHPPIRRGKRLGWQLGDVGLLVHLGMTGRWIRRDGELRHGRVAVDLHDGQRWWFEDSRRFGCLVPVPDVERAVAEGLGPDALEHPLSGLELAQVMTGRRSVKVSLMDQARIAGIGNIQAVEALWRARIHPERRVHTLSAAEWQRVSEALLWTLRRTLDDAGDGELVYLSQDKERSPFLVYAREGEPCAVCETPIHKLRVGGRTSPFCPQCQPDPSSTG